MLSAHSMHMLLSNLADTLHFKALGTEIQDQRTKHNECFLQHCTADVDIHIIFHLCVCVCVCVRVCMRACVRACMPVCASMHACLCVQACMHVCKHVVFYFLLLLILLRIQDIMAALHGEIRCGQQFFPSFKAKHVQPKLSMCQP